MMFGTREAFDYSQCAACGSVQISALPSAEVLAAAYPADYYSLGASPRMNPIMDFLVGRRNRHVMGYPNLIGAVMARFKPAPNVVPILRRVGVRPEHRIVDLGCGARAHTLNLLRRAGFRNLLGADPYIDQTLVTPAGVRVEKADADELKGPFDLVMMHHSFEHVVDPRAVLGRLFEVLAPGGAALIRIPTPSSEAYETYGADWFQMDAPRHLHLVSRKGMNDMATAIGFEVEQVFDDSGASQFSTSELYRLDIPLTQQPPNAFTPEQMAAYGARADALNAQGRGDQAAFVLRKRAA